MTHMNLFTKQKQTHRLRKVLTVSGGNGREGLRIVREFGTDMYTLLYFKWTTNKDLLYNTTNSAQYYGTT